MIYRIEGIRNEIEWDGGDDVRVRKVRSKGFLAESSRGGRDQPYFQLSADDGSPCHIFKQRLLFMLRHGITLEQSKKRYFRIGRDGEVLEIASKSRGWSNYDTLEECKETIRIIEKLQQGDYLEYYDLMFRTTDIIKKQVWRCSRIAGMRFDELFEEALELTAERLREMRFRSIYKIQFYVAREILNLNASRPRPLSSRDLRVTPSAQ